MSILSAPRRRTNRKSIRPFGEGILEAFDRTDLDRAWDCGYSLGAQGVAALAPTGWPEMLRESWIDGYTAGSARMIADGEGGEW